MTNESMYSHHQTSNYGNYPQGGDHHQQGYQQDSRFLPNEEAHDQSSLYPPPPPPPADVTQDSGNPLNMHDGGYQGLNFVEREPRGIGSGAGPDGSMAYDGHTGGPHGGPGGDAPYEPLYMHSRDPSNPAQNSQDGGAPPQQYGGDQGYDSRDYNPSGGYGNPDQSYNPDPNYGQDPSFIQDQSYNPDMPSYNQGGVSGYSQDGGRDLQEGGAPYGDEQNPQSYFQDGRDSYPGYNQEPPAANSSFNQDGGDGQNAPGYTQDGRQQYPDYNQDGGGQQLPVGYNQDGGLQGQSQHPGDFAPQNQDGGPSDYAPSQGFDVSAANAPGGNNTTQGLDSFDQQFQYRYFEAFLHATSGMFSFLEAFWECAFLTCV